jgi:hypothetical protein
MKNFKRKLEKMLKFLFFYVISHPIFEFEVCLPRSQHQRDSQPVGRKPALCGNKSRCAVRIQRGKWCLGSLVRTPPANLHGNGPRGWEIFRTRIFWNAIICIAFFGHFSIFLEFWDKSDYIIFINPFFGTTFNFVKNCLKIFMIIHYIL